MSINPYSRICGKKQYKGDIHFHTNISDGIAEPESMYERLKSCGFDFCGPADHDKPNDPGNYKGLTILSCQEMSSGKGHVVALDCKVIRNNMWTIADQIRNIRKAGGLAILSHPKIREFIPDQSITYTSGRLINELGLNFDGLEVFTRNVGSGFKTAVDRLDTVWTAMLNRQDMKPVWATASSDGHRAEHITENTGIMVWSNSPSAEDLIEAITAGHFYSIADTQARFLDISFDDSCLKASAENCRQIRLVMRAGLTAACQYYPAGEKSSFEYTTNGEEGYLRLEALDENGMVAYSNPVEIAGKDS